MRLTKKQMVKEIFFEATIGQRSANNFVQGMGIIDAIAENNYRWVIQRAWDTVNGANIDYARLIARIQMHGLVDSTRMNLKGRNLDETNRSLAFKADARVFGF